MSPSLIVKLKSELLKQPFQQTEISVKGQGLIASRDITEGSCVLCEAPLLFVPGVDFTASNIVKASMKLDRMALQVLFGLCSFLSPAQKMVYEEQLGLAFNDMNPRRQRLLATFVVNQLGGRIYLKGSRINHSCTPNLEYAWNAKINRGTFYAIHEIKEGDELTISYICGANWTKDRRQDALKSWGFICSCPACQDTVESRVYEEVRAKRRSDLRYLIEQEDRGVAADWKQCEKICESIASSQKVQGTRTREVSRSYHNAAMYSWRLGKLHRVEHWIKTELRYEKICIGIRHPDYVHGRNILTKVQAAYQDQVAYAAATDARHLDELAKHAKGLPQHQKQQATPQLKHKASEHMYDWRLDNPEKALWWANVDLEQERRLHHEEDHVAILRLAEAMEFFKQRLEKLNGELSGKGPYDDIVVWLEGRRLE